MAYTITTPLYYVNDKPHLGSTYTTIACDALARFKRLDGHNVHFTTGVDEHGLKIERTAANLGKDPKQHCDEITKTYLDLWEKSGVSFNHFVRTTDSKHIDLVAEFFKRVEKTGDIYLGEQKGWYCVGCEEFKEDDNDREQKICPIHNKKLEWRDEKNLFFKLSRYQSQIESLLDNKLFIQPSYRRNEIVNFVKKGLHDFSISRVNVKWGVPVPGYPGHTFYVWFDALLGYLSGLFESSDSINPDNLGQHGWPANIHVIGKDILRFHAIYWPAMLISAGIDIPDGIYAHGFLTREGKKMGKSLGNVLDPNQLLDSYGLDAIRWYLLKDIKFGQDGDFQLKRFIDLVNNDLANTLGNLLNRTTTMSKKWFNDTIPEFKVDLSDDNELVQECLRSIQKYKVAINDLDFSSASNIILELSTKANIFLNNQAPWSAMKKAGNELDVANDLYIVLETTRICGILLNPIVPNLSSRILQQLGCEDQPLRFDESLKWGRLKPGSSLPDSKPVMLKLEK